MTLCLPSPGDTDALVAFVLKNAHSLRRVEDEEDSTVPAVPVAVGHHELTESLESTCRGILQLLNTSSRFFSSPDGPVVAPTKFVANTLGELVQLNQSAKHLQKEMIAEGREHGFPFAPADVNESYVRFVDAVSSVVDWTTVGLCIAECRGDREGRHVAEDETLHDISNSYTAFYENSQLYFIQECTIFDPRIQRRLLMPAYFAALRDHIRSLRNEIDRLKGVDEVLKASTKGKARFNPPIQDFVFLLESLQFYLATSVIEDDLTTLTYYRILYDSVKRETQVVAERLAQLPNEPAQSSKVPVTAAAATSTQHVSATAPGTSATQQTPSAHEQCSAAFAAFDDARHRVLELQSNIRRDIEAKNQTHKTRVARFGVKAPNATPFPPEQQDASGGGGWWASLKNASNRLLCGAADVVTCRAELFPTETDVDGVPLSSTSPLASKKIALLAQVDLLVAALDAIAEGLELQYPDVYNRDWTSRLQKSASRMIQKLESMTVVFKPSA
jgi:hypothetical protein